ncbi:hypothetical protein DAI22_01g003500 [Oryza sativa Japonica Group]|nr:hypothetical protein DAI22_01g003500 [Oryza sativa Japonica Group]
MFADKDVDAAAVDRSACIRGGRAGVVTSRCAQQPAAGRRAVATTADEPGCARARRSAARGCRSSSPSLPARKAPPSLSTARWPAGPPRLPAAPWPSRAAASR